MRAWVLVVLVACGNKSETKPPPPVAPEAPPAIDREALLAGKLPEGAPESEVINAQCRICHAVEYVTQQRLSEAGWTKTLLKMRTFGANLSESDVPRLAAFAARYWSLDLPDRVYSSVSPPAGALP